MMSNQVVPHENRKAKDNCLSLVGSEPKAMCDSTAVGYKNSKVGVILEELGL